MHQWSETEILFWISFPFSYFNSFPSTHNFSVSLIVVPSDQDFLWENYFTYYFCNFKYIYIYIYIERLREKKGVCVCERERERERERSNWYHGVQILEEALPQNNSSAATYLSSLKSSK